MSRHLAGRVALVTGAGRGLGEAHAHALAAAGAAVVVNDSGVDLTGNSPDPAVVEAVARDIRGAGWQAVADCSDVSSFAGAALAVERAVAKLGRIDIVISNAGILGTARLDQLGERELHRHLAVHVMGAVGVIQAAFPHMRAQRQAHHDDDVGGGPVAAARQRDGRRRQGSRVGRDHGRGV